MESESLEEQFDLNKKQQDDSESINTQLENKQLGNTNLSQENSIPLSSPSLVDYILDYTFLFTLGGIILFIDQWTKWLIRENLAFGETWMPLQWLAPYFRIVHWKNSGAAFGLFQGFGGVFTLLAILVSIAIIYYFPQVPRKDWSLRIAMGLQLGGAVGNLIDRLIFSEVTDFISVGAFPVFNIADASISTGVAVLLLGIWFGEGGGKDKTSVSEKELESDNDISVQSRIDLKQINDPPFWNDPSRNINPISKDQKENG